MTIVSAAALCHQRIDSSRVLILAVAACLIFGVQAGSPRPALAQDGDMAPESQEPRILFIHEHAALADWLPSEKDRGLLRSLAMLPDRLRELPREIEDMEEIPAPMLELVSMMINHPMRLVVLDRGVDEETGRPGYGAAAVVEFGQRERAGRFASLVGEALGMAGLRAEKSDERPGMRQIALPPGLLTFGHREVDGVWRFESTLGAVGDLEEAFSHLPETSEHGTTVSRTRLDMEIMAPLLSPVLMAARMGGGDALFLPEMLSSMGLIGEDPLKYEAAFGYDAAGMSGRLAIEGVGRFADAYALSKTPLTDADLAIVPSDATIASVAKIDPAGYGRSLERLFESNPIFAGAMDQFDASMGIDLQEDLFETLGETIAVYFSESTGASSPLSLCVAQKVDDPDRLWSTIGKLTGRVQSLMRSGEMSAEYMRFDTSDGDVRYCRMRFPGLPVPLEPTLALTDNGWLVFGMTPQGAAAGVQQARGRGDRGLRANPAFAAALIAAPGDRQSVQFVDSSEMVGDGYSFLSIMGSALANAMRSPHGDDRDPGTVIPMFNDLAAGARPLISVSWWRGDDLVMEFRGDRSMLVNGSAMLGAYAKSLVILWPMLSGAALAPSLAQARSQAMLIRDAQNTRKVQNGVVIYATTNDEIGPPDIQALLEQGQVDAAAFDSPLGEVAGGDYFVRPQAKNNFDSSYVHAYSRAS